MRLWNLSEPGDLNQTVVEEFSATTLGHRQALRRPASKLESFKVLAGVATVGISLSFGTAMVNHSTVRLPNWSAAIVRTATNFRPPLERMFLGRFNTEWTEASEESLVNQIVENRLTRNAANSAANIPLFIYSNQQESIGLEKPRLSLAAIHQIVRKRKTS
jgi:hypothetical protein